MARTVFVVPHTHWDREWYQPHELFRWRLVQMIDELIEHMERHPDYRCFNLDGQSIVIADYLELRPENEGRLRALIEQGRVLIGPWWVQPDEFLPTGESHIRSFQRGIRYAERIGGSMRVGHCADQFGHIAQMPQLMAQLGLTSACLWRGAPDSIQGWSFWWESPDGTRLPALYLRESYSSGWRMPEDADELRAWAERASRNRREGEPALLMNGTDHSRMEPHVPQAIAAASDDVFEFRMASLAEYESAMLEAGLDGHVHRGELRSPDNSNVLVGVLSARMNLKQRDFAVQSRLERYAEPLELLLHERCGLDAQAALKQAWTLALENSPHDSICGCSVDQTHREMLPRYDRAEQLAEEVAREAMAGIAAGLQVGEPGGLVVFRAAPHAPAVIEALVPGEWDGNGLELPDGRHIPAAFGPVEPAELLNEVAGSAAQAARMLDFVREGRYEQKAVEALTWSVEDGELRIGVRAGNGINVVDDEASVREEVRRIVRQGGVERGRFVAVRGERRRVRTVLPAGESIGVEVLRPVSGDAPPASVVVDERQGVIANEHYEVRFADGAFEIRDKESGVVLQHACTLVDEGDRGDEYNADIVPDAEVVGVDTSVSVVEADGVSATMRVLTVLDVPEGLAKKRRRRKRNACCFVVAWIEVRLWAGLRRVDFHVELRNEARDHRLRALFPLPFRVDGVVTENHFHVAQRSLHTPAWNGRSAELPPTTFPQRSFVAFEADDQGVALFNRGLPEGEVVELADGRQAYALTLLRCVGWLSRRDLVSRRGHAGPQIETHDSQMIGTHQFDFALTTYAGDWRSAGVLPMAHGFAHPPMALATNAHGGEPGGVAALVSTDSPLLVPSAMCRSEANGRPVMRLWSAAGRPEEFRVRVSGGENPRRVDLLERDRGEIEADGDAWVVGIRPWEICTLTVAGEA